MGDSEYLTKAARTSVSSARSRLSPTSVLPHTWGRKMLQYASSEAACGSVSLLKYGSVSFPRFAGEGRDGGQRALSER